jgi:hypothetical protein
MRGALCLSMRDFHEKAAFDIGAFWKNYFAPAFRESISLTSKQQTFLKIG